MPTPQELAAALQRNAQQYMVLGQGGPQPATPQQIAQKQMQDAAIKANMQMTPERMAAEQAYKQRLAQQDAQQVAKLQALQNQRMQAQPNQMPNMMAAQVGNRGY